MVIAQTYLETLNLYKMPDSYILSSVWVRLSIFSQLSIMGLSVFSLPISLVMIERIYTLSYYHHQIGSMNYYPLFRVRSWNSGIRCMSLYIFILMTPSRQQHLSKPMVAQFTDADMRHRGVNQLPINVASFPGSAAWPIFCRGRFKCIYLNEYECILIQISIRFVLKSPTDN